MKRSTFLSQLLVLTACAAVVLAADKAVDKKKLFEEYMQKFGPPGPEHKFLEPLVGNWQAKVKMWMDPSQPPQTGDGTLTRKAILGGRFIQEEYNGKMGEHPFQGVGTMGYDRAKKKYVSTWMDSMSTAIHMSKGTYDESAKTWTFTNEEDCPITGERVKMRDVLRIVGPDEQQMTMYRQMGGEKEEKMMEITFTRQK